MGERKNKASEGGRGGGLAVMTPFKGGDVRGDGLSRDDGVAAQVTWLSQRRSPLLVRTTYFLVLSRLQDRQTEYWSTSESRGWTALSHPMSTVSPPVCSSHPLCIVATRYFLPSPPPSVTDCVESLMTSPGVRAGLVV